MRVIEVENFFPSKIITELVSTANNNSSLFKYGRPAGSWRSRNEIYRSQFDLTNCPLLETDIKEHCISIIQPTVDFSIEFSSATIWKDDPGFYMTTHKDNFGIFISMQIYLNNNNCPGTLFLMDDDRTKLIKYGYNRGYILHNYIRPRVDHEIPQQINSESRLSVYILFRKIDENGKAIVTENEQENWGPVNGVNKSK